MGSGTPFSVTMPRSSKRNDFPMHSSRTRDGHDDVVGRGRVAQPGRELDSRTEQVAVVVGDRLAGADPDADVQRHCGLLIAVVERALHRGGEVDRGGDRRERRHDPVTGVLHLTAVVGHELGAHDLVVLAEQADVRVVTELHASARRSRTRR